MFAGLLLAHKLWLSGRFYPQTPVWSSWKLPFPFDVAALVALLLLLVLIAAAPKPTLWIAPFGCWPVRCWTNRAGSPGFIGTHGFVHSPLDTRIVA